MKQSFLILTRLMIVTAYSLFQARLSVFCQAAPSLSPTFRGLNRCQRAEWLSAAAERQNDAAVSSKGDCWNRGPIAKGVWAAEALSQENLHAHLQRRLELFQVASLCRWFRSGFRYDGGAQSRYSKGGIPPMFSTNHCSQKAFGVPRCTGLHPYPGIYLRALHLGAVFHGTES